MRKSLSLDDINAPNGGNLTQTAPSGGPSSYHGLWPWLVILGIRLSELPVGQPLCHQDMELIALEPMTNATKETVDVCLEDAVSTTGVPRAIVDDHEADLHGGGVKIFIDRHPETDEIYDIKHMAACLLKARLQKDERWKSFAASRDWRSLRSSRPRWRSWCRPANGQRLAS